MFIALCCHAYGNVQLMNDVYLRMNSNYEATYSEMTRIIDRVEQLPEWQEGNRTLYFDFGEEGGYLNNKNYQAYRCVDDYIDMGWMTIIGAGVHPFWGDHNTRYFAKCYLGLEFESPTDAQIEAIKKRIFNS